MGFETIKEAIEAVRAGDAWPLREDRHGLAKGDTSASPVEFTDERGWVYLSVELERLDNTWLVSGYETYAPEGF